MKHLIKPEKYFENIFDIFKKKQDTEVATMTWTEIFKEYDIRVDICFYEQISDNQFEVISSYQDIGFLKVWPRHPDNPENAENLICLKVYYKDRLIGKVTETRNDYQMTIFKVKGYFYKSDMLKSDDVVFRNFKRTGPFDTQHSDINTELSSQPETPVSFTTTTTQPTMGVNSQVQKAQTMILDWHQSNTKPGRRKFYGTPL